MFTTKQLDKTIEKFEYETSYAAHRGFDLFFPLSVSEAKLVLEMLKDYRFKVC